MKNIWILSGAVLFAAFLLVDSANAGREDRRQGAQRARIREGVKSGELTAGEAARARAGQRQVNRMEKRAEADGEISEGEAARIERKQDRESKQLHRMKHNKRSR